jgi:hypothetical protein
MTTIERDIATAEICEWEPHYDGEEKWRNPQGKICIGISPYHSSRDAMAEAEDVLTEENRGKYSDILWRMCGKAEFRTITATASQRQEAFLRVFNKWKD